MLNAVYRLVAPRRFEVEFGEVPLFGQEVIVRPTHLSICHADQRYYQGSRPAEVLKQKLPMALIHEGIGKVVHDPSKFRASGFDGFMQEYVSLQPDRLVVLPEGIDPVVAAFTELVSVSVHALQRFDRIAHARRNMIGIWGDGNLGYITAIFCKAMFPDTKLAVFGVDNEKLANFAFADATYRVTDIPEGLLVDHAFECVGGAASQSAIDQIIDHIQPEGTIGLLGVSEYPVPINTRMVLEKGLRLYGSSRSGRSDFVKTVELYQSHPEIVNYLDAIVGARIEVRSMADMVRAFEMDIHKSMGKTIMHWMQ